MVPSWVSPAYITCNIYLVGFLRLTAVFMATNSVLKLHISVVDCFFEHQLIHTVFWCRKNPVWYLYECLLPVWSISMNMQRSTAFPNLSGTLNRIDSSTSPYYSLQTRRGNRVSNTVRSIHDLVLWCRTKCIKNAKILLGVPDMVVPFAYSIDSSVHVSILLSSIIHLHKIG